MTRRDHLDTWYFKRYKIQGLYLPSHVITIVLSHPWAQEKPSASSTTHDQLPSHDLLFLRRDRNGAELEEGRHGTDLGIVESPGFNGGRGWEREGGEGRRQGSFLFTQRVLQRIQRLRQSHEENFCRVVGPPK